MRKVKLHEVADVVISNVDKKSKDGQKTVRLCNFVDVYYNWAITDYMRNDLMIATASDAEIQKFQVHKGQVALTKDSETRDDIGIPTYIADEMEDVVLGYHCALITPHEGEIDGRFLNAYLNSTNSKKYFANNASGSGQRYTLSLDTLRDIQIFLPDIDEQIRIGKIFSDIDSKIALNRRINQKLEETARRLYDYWFLQFDFPAPAGSVTSDGQPIPEGAPYRSSGGAMSHNATLNRPVPTGWEVVKLGKVCNCYLGGTPSTAVDEFWNGDIHWLNSGEVADFPITKSEKTITPKAIEKSATVLMPKGSVTYSITRYLRASILAIDACINQSVIGVAENEKFKNTFIYPLLLNETDGLMKKRTGANQPHINKDIFESVTFAAPDDSVMKKYNEAVSPLYDEIINTAKEIDRLVALRDRLLPLLMNGQVTLI